jgi:hypothetical protein
LARRMLLEKTTVSQGEIDFSEVFLLFSL